MDILGTPLSVHVDFSMTPLHFILKKFTVGIYWNFEIQIYYKIFVEYLDPNTFILYSSNSSSMYLQIPDIKCKNVGIIIHMDRGLDPPSPMWTNMDILGTPLPPRLSTWFVDDPLEKMTTS